MTTPNTNLANSGEVLQGIFDKTGVQFNAGDVIKHNNNVFILKYSETQKQYVLRVKDDTGMNWRDFNWIKRCSKHCEILTPFPTNQ